MFTRLAELARRPRAVLLLMSALLAAGIVGGGDVQAAMRGGGTIDPASASALATAAIERDAPGLAPNLVLLVSGPGSLDAPATVAAADVLTRTLTAEPGVVGVTSYWQGPVPALRADDGRSALITARIEGEESEIAATLAGLRPRIEGAQGEVEVALAGPAVVRATMDATISSDLLLAELVALPVTFLVLLLVFGGFWAALLPLLVGVFAIVGTNAVLRVVAEFTDVSVFALNLTTALGLGLAIDYALLIVRRYREERAGGGDHESALAATLHSAGRTVAFSGLTVAAALSAMLVFPLYFLRSFAYAGIAVVLLSMIGALVIAPAAMTLLRNRLAGRRRRARPAAGAGGWARLSLAVSRHARLVAPLSVLALLAVALPFASVQFGAADERQLPEGSVVRVVQETVRDGFPGAAEPVAVAVLPASTPAATLAAVTRDAAALPLVTAVTPVRAGDSVILDVRADAGAGSEQAQQVVAGLRAVAAPAGGLVGGSTASLVDTRDAIGSGLPTALAIIVVTSLLLVFLLTGSVLLPLQTVLTNALSLTAMFGAIVWVFQDGNLAPLLGFTPTGTIDVALPLLMACVAFGLSMDYGVFFVARLVEERERGGDQPAVLARTLQRTGGVITAAAVILSTVLVAIGSSQITNTKMLGLGVALAVLVDATVIRCVVVPALLTLLGPATWWAPAPLRALHRRIGWREEAPRPQPRVVVDAPVPAAL